MRMVSPLTAASTAAWMVAQPPLPTSRKLCPAPSLIFSTPVRKIGAGRHPRSPASRPRLPTVVGSPSATVVTLPLSACGAGRGVDPLRPTIVSCRRRVENVGVGIHRRAYVAAAAGDVLDAGHRRKAGRVAGGEVDGHCAGRAGVVERVGAGAAGDGDSLDPVGDMPSIDVTAPSR